MDYTPLISNLGVPGLALFIMWWMYDSSVKERKSNDERLDKKDIAFRELEKEVRTEIVTQLIASTQTNTASQKVMERVLDKLGEK